MRDEQSPDAISGEPLDFATKAVILLGGIIAALALTAISSVLPKIESALAHGATDKMLVKQLIGGVGLAMVAGAAVAGLAVSRLGLGRMLMVASGVYVIAGTAGLYLSDLRLLVASRLILGLAAAAIQITSLTLINTRLQGRARAQWLGINISVASISTIIVHPIAGALGEWSWRLPFVLYLAGLVLVPAALCIKDPVAQREAGGTQSAAPGGGILSWFPLHYLLLAFCIGTLSFLPTIYTPFLLRQAGVISPLLIGTILTADAIASASTALLYGQFRKRGTAQAAYAFSFAMATAGALVIILTGNFTGIFAGLLVYGLGVGWLVPNMLNSLAERLRPEQQGRAVGLVKAAHFSAAPLSVLFVAPIDKTYGPIGAMAAVAAMAAILFAAVAIRAAWRRSLPSESNLPGGAMGEAGRPG